MEMRFLVEDVTIPFGQTKSKTEPSIPHLLKMVHAPERLLVTQDICCDTVETGFMLKRMTVSGTTLTITRDRLRGLCAVVSHTEGKDFAIGVFDWSTAAWLQSIGG